MFPVKHSRGRRSAGLTRGCGRAINRGMSARLLLAFCLIALSGCTPRGTIMVDPDAAAVGAVQPVFVGTTRRDGGEAEPFSRGRGFATRFARFDVSIPPDRELGSLPWPPRYGVPDPRRHMLTVASQIYRDDAAFRSALAVEMRRSRRGMREAVVFVHGFNSTFAEGLYRFAQLHHDMELPGVPVHYSWPSRGTPLGYAYDRDSALFARDGLERLLHEVTAAGADRVHLVAHSMGSALTMEALRQLAIRKDRSVMSRIGGVILISPDIDVDVFRAQAQAVGKLPQPFVIFTSAQDRALGLSARLAGEAARLGNLRDLRVLAGLEVTLLEVGAFSTGDGHFTAGTSPTLLRLLNRIGDVDAALGRDASSRIGLLPGAVLSIQGATQVILSPVAAIGLGQ